MAPMHFDIWSFLLILGIGQGLFALLSLSRSRPSGMGPKILALLVIILTFHLAEFLVLNAGYYAVWPHLMRVSEPFLFLIGPALYFFVVSNSRPDFSFQKRHLIHLVPFALALAFVAPWYFNSGEFKAEGYERMITGGATGIGIIGFVYASAHMLVTLGYTYMALKTVTRQDNSTTPVFLKRFIQIFLGYWVFQLIGLVVITAIQYYIFYIDYALSLINALFIQYLALLLTSKNAAFSKPMVLQKYQRSGLSLNAQKTLLKEFNLLIGKEVYLDSELNLQKLADQLDVNKSYLSQVINQEFNCSFTEFINQRRIEHAIQLMKSPEYVDTKLFAIALDSGFNNKTSFHRAFSRQKGQSPSAYRSSLQVIY